MKNIFYSIQPLLLALDAEIENNRIYSPLLQGSLFYSKIHTEEFGDINCFLFHKIENKKVTQIYTGFGGEKLTPKGACSAEEFLLGKECSVENLQKAGDYAANDLKLINEDKVKLIKFFTTSI